MIIPYLNNNYARLTELKDALLAKHGKAMTTLMNIGELFIKTNYSEVADMVVSLEDIYALAVMVAPADTILKGKFEPLLTRLLNDQNVVASLRENIFRLNMVEQGITFKPRQSIINIIIQRVEWIDLFVNSLNQAVSVHNDILTLVNDTFIANKAAKNIFMPSILQKILLSNDDIHNFKNSFPEVSIGDLVFYIGRAFPQRQMPTQQFYFFPPVPTQEVYKHLEASLDPNVSEDVCIGAENLEVMLNWLNEPCKNPSMILKK